MKRSMRVLSMRVLSMWVLSMLVLSLLALAGCGRTDQADAGRVHVSDAWSRATPPGAPVAAGFLTLHNPGPYSDRLVSVRTAAAARVEIHEVRDEDGVSRMRQLADGLPLPAGQTVVLAPGGYHLMLVGPRQAFTPGQRIGATLTFERAPAADVSFEVRSPSGQPAPAAPGAEAHSGHDQH